MVPKNQAARAAGTQFSLTLGCRQSTIRGSFAGPLRAPKLEF